MQHLVAWYDNNNLFLNTKKANEIIVDFWRTGQSKYRPLFICLEAVQRLSNVKIWRVTVTEDLSWGSRIIYQKWEGQALPIHLKEAEEHPHPQLSNIYNIFIYFYHFFFFNHTSSNARVSLRCYSPLHKSNYCSWLVLNSRFYCHKDFMMSRQIKEWPLQKLR